MEEIMLPRQEPQPMVSLHCDVSKLRFKEIEAEALLRRNRIGYSSQQIRRLSGASWEVHERIDAYRLCRWITESHLVALDVYGAEKKRLNMLFIDWIRCFEIKNFPSTKVTDSAISTSDDAQNFELLLARKGYSKLLMSEKIRLAVLVSKAAFQFFNGIGGDLHLDSQEREVTGRKEEVCIATRYFCYHCRQVVTVDGEIKCPLCQGGWIQECGGVSSLYLSMRSESEHSSTDDSDGQGGIVIPSSHETHQQAIVKNFSGSDSNPNRLSFHCVDFQDYNIHDEPQQISDDFSLSDQSHLLGVGSEANTNNNMPGHVGPSDSTLSTELLPDSIGANIGSGQPHHETEVTRLTWFFTAIGISTEAASAYFDQISTPKKPHYALYGMLLSIVALPVCILDLIHNVRTQCELASGSDVLWGILPEIFGLALACLQCISSSLQFSFLRKHAANPLKISFVPFLFFFALFAFKYRK